MAPEKKELTDTTLTKETQKVLNFSLDTFSSVIQRTAPVTYTSKIFLNQQPEEIGNFFKEDKIENPYCLIGAIDGLSDNEKRLAQTIGGIALLSIKGFLINLEGEDIHFLTKYFDEYIKYIEFSVFAMNVECDMDVITEDQNISKAKEILKSIQSRIKLSSIS